MKSKKPKLRIYSLTHHVCRFCGFGRILREETPGLITGGGNPIWTCSGCLRSSAAMFPHVHCYCGWDHRSTQCWDVGQGPIDETHFRHFKTLSNLSVIERRKPISTK